MAIIEEDLVVGSFRGCNQEGFEFRAELVLPYRSDMHLKPMLGQFVVVELEHASDAMLGRVRALTPEGRLTEPSGDEYSVRSVTDRTPIPDNVKEDHLRYRVGIQVLGMMREKDGKVTFIPSVRRIPHVGSRVAFVSPRLLKIIAGTRGPEIGFLAYADFVYAGGDPRCVLKDWMTDTGDAVPVRLELDGLDTKKIFAFAKAGFGKSNLVKTILSILYKDQPLSAKLGIPLGTLLFDPEGEYGWPDNQGRPGLCDVPHLKDKLVMFTSRKSRSPFYSSFVAGSVKLDIRQLLPADVASLALPAERQQNQNVVKIKGVKISEWPELVDLIHAHGNNAPTEQLMKILRMDSDQKNECLAARSNLTYMVNLLHDPSSRFIDRLFMSLKRGCICIVDISLLGGRTALVLSGLILKKIFDQNQDEFHEISPNALSCLAVLEEAQSVLRRDDAATAPYIEWVKEGRKYALGAFLITQQPGSISGDLLSQANYFFAAHLLAGVDLRALKDANCQFSDDLLMNLAGETIHGNMIMWTDAEGRSYPVPMRIFSFEKMYTMADPGRDRTAPETVAQDVVKTSVGKPTETKSAAKEQDRNGDVDPDFFTQARREAMEAVAKLPGYLEKVLSPGKPWKDVLTRLEQALPDGITDKNYAAAPLVPQLMNTYVGPENEAWKVEQRPRANGEGDVRYIVGLPGAKVRRSEN